MSWTQRYWDSWNQLYWDPKYLGLLSLGRLSYKTKLERLKACKKAIKTGKSIYFRPKSEADNAKTARRMEETFNQIFDIALSICPDDVVAEIFGPLVGLNDCPRLQCFGPEIGKRYGWNLQVNRMQHDGFYVGVDTIVALEMKFDAKTSVDQIAKYLFLILHEEIHSGSRAHVSLLYLRPTDNNPLAKEIGIDTGTLSRANIDRVLKGCKAGERIQTFLDANRDRLADLLDRITIVDRTWNDLETRLGQIVSNLGDTKGDRTLARLLTGLATEIRAHPKSGLVS